MFVLYSFFIEEPDRNEEDLHLCFRRQVIDLSLCLSDRIMMQLKRTNKILPGENVAESNYRGCG